ncbi:zinc finger protein 25-like [Pararge aegeria]|uniref:zinc finger protein 25-like n=1 Tax=Pararge aegeria TaxID=116150 RepID=UPI0019CF7C6C|nr:zinc finger protein 25-like [Pararge aegeria]
MSVNTRKGPIFDPGLCRCCGAIKKCRLLNVEYTWNDQKETYSDMFMDCFGLLLSHLDGEEAERLICATCVCRLREAASFRRQVLQCEETLLRTKIHGDGESCCEIKEEIKVKEEIINGNTELSCLDYDDATENIDDLEEDALVPAKKPKRKSLRQKLKSGKKGKSKKINKEDSADDTEMLYLVPDEKLMEQNEFTYQEASYPQKQNGYKTENTKRLHNILTIIENSYACPFDTSFSDYFCVYCRQVFTDPNKLRDHSMTHDPRGFKDVLTNGQNNKKVQIDVYRIDCRLCPEPINDLEQFKNHITIHGKALHNDSDDYLKFKLTSGTLSCTECNSTFGFFHALKKHTAEHFGTCICDVCGAHYFEERMLALHQKTHQRVDETFTCKECGKSFKSKYTRYMHIARAHKKEAAYQCNKCDEVFFSYTLRYRHMIEVHGEERRFQCEQCDRAYDSRKSLREHNRRYHLKILKHQCDLCEKRFYLPSRLKEHMASHTGERNFRCEYCGKSYPRLRGLKVHMQSHSSDKKYKCGLCSASFTQNVNLKNHIKRQHQGMDLDENYQE